MSRFLESSVTNEFVRYFLASLVALILDIVVLRVSANHMHYLLAATLGFVIGAGAIYFLSTYWVYRRRRLADRRHSEISIFVAIGVLGLGLNDLIIFIGVDYFASSLIAAKLFAACASFLFNYTARKLALF